MSRQEKSTRKQPDLSRLKHSGQLENDADVVIFIYQACMNGYTNWTETGVGAPDLTTENTAKVYVEKGRNYGLAESYCMFYPHKTYFKDYAEENNLPLNYEF